MSLNKTLIFYYNKSKQIAIFNGPDNKPYGWVYDSKDVYYDDEGNLLCMKHLTKIKRLWNQTGTGGDFWCDKCQDYHGKFTALGYGTELKTNQENP